MHCKVIPVFKSFLTQLFLFSKKATTKAKNTVCTFTRLTKTCSPSHHFPLLCNSMLLWICGPLGQSAWSSTRICVHLPKTQQLGPECWVIHKNMCLAVIVIVIVINFNNRSGRRRMSNIHYQLCIISVSLLTHVISIAAGWARATWNERSSNVTANDVEGCSWAADGPANTAVAVKKLDSFGSFESKSCLWSFFLFLSDPLS